MCFVCGIRNSLLSGDGAGPAVIDRLSSDPHLRARITYRDSGTVGLALLPEIEASNAFIAADAAEPGAPAGTVQVLLDEKMDAQPRGRKKTVHEVALADLPGVAMLAGTLPSRLFPILTSSDAALNQTCGIALGFSFVPMFASRVCGGCRARN